MKSHPLRDPAPAYSLRGVRIRFGPRTVLDVPDLEIPRGRITALVGPNGAGKTTLLRVLAFLLAPTEGCVFFGGDEVRYDSRELLRLRRRVTMVGQGPLLFRRSVRANVAYGLRVRGRRDPGRVERALAVVGMTAAADRPAWRLSSGEAQRVAIARALAVDPEVLLLDEPTANIDREHAGLIESLVARLGSEETTVVLATHSAEQAYRLGQHIVSLSAGELAPVSLANILRGETIRQDGAQYFVAGGLRIEVANGCQPMALALDPEDILVSRHPIDSSARNCFPGCISKVEEDERGVILTIECAGIALLARITRRSYREMELNLGARVFVTFKSSALHVLSEA